MVQLRHAGLVLEALLHVGGGDGEAQVLAGHQGPGELVDAVVHALVVHHQLCAGQVHLLLDAAAAHVQVQRVDRSVALVVHGDLRHGVQAALGGHQVDGEADVGVVRLQHALVPLVGALVVFQVVLHGGGIGHLVQHLGIVVTPGAEQHPGGEGGDGVSLVGAQAAPGDGQSLAEMCFPAAHPEEQRDHEQHGGKGPPIGLEPQPAR